MKHSEDDMYAGLRQNSDQMRAFCLATKKIKSQGLLPMEFFGFLQVLKLWIWVKKINFKFPKSFRFLNQKNWDIMK